MQTLFWTHALKEFPGPSLSEVSCEDLESYVRGEEPANFRYKGPYVVLLILLFGHREEELEGK